MYFYKYNSVSPLSLMMLKRGEVYFASSAELNDRHECRSRYIFSGSKEVWIRFIDYVLVELAIKCGMHCNSEDADKLISLSDFVYELFFKKNRHKTYDISGLVNLLTDSIVESLDVELSNNYQKYIVKFMPELFMSIKHNNLREQKYISSFSLNAINPTMWGHYASAESGYLVIYKSENGDVKVNSTLKNLSDYRKKAGFTEIGRYDTEVLSLNAVKYRKLPCKVNAFSRLIHKFRYSEIEEHYDFPESLYGDISKLEQDLVGLVKYTDWKYEKEVRLLFPTFEELPSELRCLQVDCEHIKGVVFGASTSIADKERIIMACYHLHQTSKPNFDFVFLQAEESIKMYEMDIIPVGILTDLYINKILPLQRFNELDKQKQQMLLEMCVAIGKGS